MSFVQDNIRSLLEAASVLATEDEKSKPTLRELQYLVTFESLNDNLK
jgi:hypothetical protein